MLTAVSAPVADAPGAGAGSWRVLKSLKASRLKVARDQLIDRQPIEVIEPGQRLVDPHVASRRLLPWDTFRGGILPRSDAAAIGLRHTALLSSARIPGVRRLSEERYRPHPTGRVTRRAGGLP